MKKLVIFSVTALAAAVLTGTPAMTAQAAVRTYRIQAGDFSGSNLFGTGGSCQNGGGYGNSCQNGSGVWSGGQNGGSCQTILPGGTCGSGSQDCTAGNQTCITGGQDCGQNGGVIFDGSSSMEGGFLKPIKPGQGEILPGVSGNGNQNQPGGGEQKPDEKPDVKPDEKPDVKPDIKPDEKPDVKPDEKPNEKPDVKPDEKPNEKPDVKPDEKPDEKPDVQDSYVEQVLELVNAERAKAGAAALTLDSRAEDAAQLRAEEIQSSFSHTRPDGSSFSTALTQAGVNYSASGENIAYGQNSPQAVMESWMNSSGHRANILNQNFTSIGIGHAQGGNGVDYWTQLFFR